MEAFSLRMLFVFRLNYFNKNLAQIICEIYEYNWCLDIVFKEDLILFFLLLISFSHPLFGYK